MGTPAHTATHGVNVRIEGPRPPPMGLTCASKGPDSHPWANHASRLAQNAVHFAQIGPFSGIFTEVDCGLGQETGDNTAPTAKPGHALARPGHCLVQK